MSGTPFHCRFRTDLRTERARFPHGCHQPAGRTPPDNAGAANKDTYLRKREPCPVQGDSRGVPNDHEPAVPVTDCAMRRQTAQAGAPRQKVARSCARSCCEIPVPGVFVSHVGPIRVLSPSASIGCTRISTWSVAVHANLPLLVSGTARQWRRTCLRSCRQLGEPRLQHAEWRDG